MLGEVDQGQGLGHAEFEMSVTYLGRQGSVQCGREAWPGWINLGFVGISMLYIWGMLFFINIIFQTMTLSIYWPYIQI